MANDSLHALRNFEQTGFDDASWELVDVPHNWDQYEGYRRLRHGNRHGYAAYRKTFRVEAGRDRRYFLWFEGVGSYASVWLNEKKVGYHAGGRTSFTLDVTEVIRTDTVNVLAVRADHPAFIDDLPWVCGGCSHEVGFSEGSQPIGIFRPVHLVITDPVRVEPFGVHIWNDTAVSEKAAVLNISTEIKNYGHKARTVTLASRLVDKEGREITFIKDRQKIRPGETIVIKKQTPVIANPRLWSPADPYLYTLVTDIMEKGKVIDRVSTPYGIRWIRWDTGAGGTNRFYINGNPVFLNGTAAYEHLIGQSHAFSAAQVRARAMQVKAAGFNAFRDAHQPHNLRYQHYWDSLGILWWTQHTAHIWYDTPAFRENFKQLLKEWVKERRNSPSLILWGLQNESHLPEDFARECTRIIRALDPTTSVQRKVTTCNGGEGTDWNVPQNWTGTYGGDPTTYADDIRRQVLIGEYGGWRSIDLHTEGPFDPHGPRSEEQLAQLMEMKIRLAESVKDRCSGHFHWLFTSHENPGRVQGGEGLRELDRVGPVNYKGLITAWGEPTDLFYMFRAAYAPKETDPMVYIASHTWPDRWTTPGKKNGLVVYSNCDSVTLFNDAGGAPLGTKVNRGRGTHLQWNDVPVKYNVLYASGYVDGKEAARDCIVLHHLPRAPHFSALLNNADEIIGPQPGVRYCYRVNCGGPEYKDAYGNLWMADTHKEEGDSTWGSASWTDGFEGMPPFYGSQRRTHDPVAGTSAWPLFQTFRYGRDKLRYDFPVPAGDYIIELYFTEPWYGAGGGMDCTGWRLFDVAVNGQTMIRNLDIWKEAGHDTALKKVIRAHVSGGMLSVSFPGVSAGQAVIAAMAIAPAGTDTVPAAPPSRLIKNLKVYDPAAAGLWSARSWLDTGHKQYAGSAISFSKLPPELYGAGWIRAPVVAAGRKEAPFRHGTDTVAEFQVAAAADVYIALDECVSDVPAWLAGYEDTRTVIENDHRGTHRFRVYRKRFAQGATVALGNNGSCGEGQALMYTAVVRPVTAMQPAVDLRPSATYSIEQARITGEDVQAGTVLNRRCATFTGGKKASLQWTISLGVANLYALRFRYFHAGDKALTVNLTIQAADGTIMKTENLEFLPVTENKWKTAVSSTGSMINAGSYNIILTPAEAAGLSIRSLEVQ